VVREAARASDSGDHDEVFARDAELRKHALHRIEDGVVSATRTPPHFLVGREILLGEIQFWIALDHATPPLTFEFEAISLMRLRISISVNGLPWILVRETTGFTNLPCSTNASCPMLSSGTRTASYRSMTAFKLRGIGLR